MPFPSEDTTPPVTNTNLVIGTHRREETTGEQSSGSGGCPPVKLLRIRFGHHAPPLPDDAPRGLARRRAAIFVGAGKVADGDQASHQRKSAVPHRGATAARLAPETTCVMVGDVRRPRE